MYTGRRVPVALVRSHQSQSGENAQPDTSSGIGAIVERPSGSDSSDKGETRNKGRLARLSNRTRYRFACWQAVPSSRTCRSCNRTDVEIGASSIATTSLHEVDAKVATSQ